MSGDPLEVPSNVNGDDWPAKASATVVHYVGTVRDRTTGPALVASRWVVYALAMSLIAVVALIVLLLLMVRFGVVVTGYLPFVEPGESWMAYYVLAVPFIGFGWYAWRKKDD